MAGCGRPPSAGTVTVARDPAGRSCSRTSVAEFRLLPSGELQRRAARRGEVALAAGAGRPRRRRRDRGRARGRVRPRPRAAPWSTDVQGSLGPGQARRSAAGAGAAGAPRRCSPSRCTTTSRTSPSARSATATAGPGRLTLTKVVQQAHRLNASLADPKAAPFELWSFHGASVDWGEDEILPLAKGFSRPNVLGAQLARGTGGGVPVVAFWTASVGAAIGHLEPLPQVASLPVTVEADGRVAISLVVEPLRTLAPGEAYTAPRSFLAVFAGDFYEPLRLYSLARQREGWPIPRPSDAAYEPAWCGWGYEFDVTPAQMLGTIPKLKELGIPWATLDDRWFEGYGDWLPRKDTFPGDSIRTMVEAFHREGIKVQIWWLPLGVEDGEAKYAVAPLRAEHRRRPAPRVADPRRGGPPRADRPPPRRAVPRRARGPGLPPDADRAVRARLGLRRAQAGQRLHRPALPQPRAPPPLAGRVHPGPGRRLQDDLRDDPRAEARQRHADLPLRHAAQRGLAAVHGPGGDGRPGGRVPGAPAHQDVQGPARAGGGGLRRPRRALGDEADRARTTGSRSEPTSPRRSGRAGSWARSSPGRTTGRSSKPCSSTPAKEAHWKKWLGIYNANGLARGTFLNLYVHGYDVPEGYAIAKDGRMHYAFFAPDPAVPWKGRIELRGLRPGPLRGP